MRFYFRLNEATRALVLLCNGHFYTVHLKHPYHFYCISSYPWKLDTSTRLTQQCVPRSMVEGGHPAEKEKNLKLKVNRCIWRYDLRGRQHFSLFNGAFLFENGIPEPSNFPAFPQRLSSIQSKCTIWSFSARHYAISEQKNRWLFVEFQLIVLTTYH